MRINGMCPLCFIKRLLTRPSKISIEDNKKYKGGGITAPPMGWSSWNTFKNHIDEKVIYDTAQALVNTGLLKAGYQYINIDDCWQSSMRDEDGKLQGDLATFSSGIKDLVKKVNALGVKLGIYSSNGSYTCEDLPASLGNERRDANTFAEWGVEYVKYDFCHNVPYPEYAPLIYGITVSGKGIEDTFYPAKEARLLGAAKILPSRKTPVGYYVSALDRNEGAMEYTSVTVPNKGEYIVTVNIKKKGQYNKFLRISVNGKDAYDVHFPEQKFWNDTARFQTVVALEGGQNTLRLYNPIGTKADSAMLQYKKMGEELLAAGEKYGKKIVFSICEWGFNNPHEWGAAAGNLWRTSADIAPYWLRVMYNYHCTVDKYEYAEVGSYNDPDMLEVGNGHLSSEENKTHFSLWCMMMSPLILGNDLRNIKKEVLEIVTNKNLIAIDKDPLGKQAKRLKKGKIDILARPLADGSVALCLFNKSKKAAEISFDLSRLVEDKYVALIAAKEYEIVELWEESVTKGRNVAAQIPSHGVKVYKITAAK